MTDFEVNIKTLIANKLSFEAYFILYSLYKNDKELILAYIHNCDKINTDTFKQLQDTNYLTIKNPLSGDIHFEDLYITDKTRQLFKDNEDIDQLFNEFRGIYPSSVKSGLTIRRLHGNLKKCKLLYAKLLEEVSHDILCKCAKLYYDEKFNSGALMYMQNLETWLNQRNYMQYVEDIDKREEKTTFTDDI